MELGRGTFGVVTEDEDEKYAIKTIKNGLAISGICEALILSECDHPNIVKLTDIRIADSITLVMERWEISLDLYIKYQTLIEVEIVDNLMRGILRAIDYVHSRGIIHADIKPSNILINTYPWQVALCDFGGSIINTAQIKTSIIQAKLYRAPEVNVYSQIFDGGSNNYSFPIDMWGLGCILYKLCAGSDMFRHDVDEDTTIDLSRLYMMQRSTRTSRLGMLYTIDRNKVADLLGGKIAHTVGRTRLNYLIKKGIFDITIDSLLPNPQTRITASAALTRLGVDVTESKVMFADQLSVDARSQCEKLANYFCAKFPQLNELDKKIITLIASSIFPTDDHDLFEEDEADIITRISELLTVLIRKNRNQCDQNLPNSSVDINH